MTSINSEQGYALLEAIIDKQPDCPLLQAFLGSRGGVGCEPNALMEHLELLTSTQLELFWSKINELTVCSSTKVGLAEDSDEDVRDNAAGSQEWTDAIGTLLKISQIVIGFIERSKSRPKSLFTTLVTLHDMLTLLNCDEENENVLQAAIAKACETWWHMNEHGRELVVTQLIAYLLLRAVDHDHSDAFVKRLFGVRACFQLLDFDDDSIESIRGLILRCFVHPRFLKVFYCVNFDVDLPKSINIPCRR